MNVLIFCPAAQERAALSRHLIAVGSYRLFIADTEPLVVSIALNNEVDLALLCDPKNIKSIVALKDFLREKRRHMRVRILPSRNGLLLDGWREVVNEALKPVKPRQGASLGAHPRFQWKPNN